MRTWISFRKTVLLSGAAISCVFSHAGLVFAGLGAVTADFPFRSYELLADPIQPYVYASVPALDAVEVINTKTLTAQEISLGATPQGIALSPDGQSLYVAEPGNSQIATISTQSLDILRTITTPSAPYEIAAGLDGRLIVLDAASPYTKIQQINALTGATAGPDFPGYFFYYGNFQISPGLNTLYYGEHGLSPTTLFAYDVSTTNVTLTQQINTGSNGYNVVLSHNGKWVAQPNGAPYAVSLLQASNFETLGTFDTGPYPNNMAFSPDDKLAYVSHDGYPTAITVYNTSTFASVGQFNVPDEINALTTDATGQYLFASMSNVFSSQPETIVYETGYAVPEPQSLALLATSVLGVLIYIRRRKSVGRS